MGPNGDRSECHGTKLAGSTPSYHIGDQLPESVRQQWLAGLELGFSGIFTELQVIEREQISPQQVAASRRKAEASQAYRFIRIHNIPAHHAMALAFAGKSFNRPA